MTFSELIFTKQGKKQCQKMKSFLKTIKHKLRYCNHHIDFEAKKTEVGKSYSIFL